MDKKILTVGELKELLTGISNDTQVVMASGDWYANIGTVVLPDGETYSAVTFYEGSGFDPRQV